jgi:hypothetical protein
VSSYKKNKKIKLFFIRFNQIPILFFFFMIIALRFDKENVDAADADAKMSNGL